ncbi:DUF805 domain-containing protein [Pragia fontium]|uniref:Uncharacterized membrane protein YhaH, DUF805 family n=2 Tax=Pragia fontium TaxID=82985 RepID=A0AAJ5BIG2_9GAMM|nr:DUF805 domain-containing protein [Pragia fontium]AKJ43673.1 membrane protein [Pragia fontium]SFD34041.1 Uncharacterized membrane protein YhaH, DUF805 family [Pragia fontium DSM 5563 = ATCC 49100]SUB84172.1 Inner membrane protein yhaI [Pragia fontium]VEJ57065.1 Inner membrane protein yhaI [Pragia fontium]GKX64542.1 hypothetical protein SOASR032_31110 [Pragia fontium]
MEWYKKCFTQYADFSGRARRKEYWMFTLFNLLAIIVLAIVGSILDSVFGSNGAVTGILLIVYSLAIIIPSLSVTVRRLHDTDKTGWWYLLVFIPFGSLVLLVFTILEGTAGPNTYGPSPK